MGSPGLGEGSKCRYAAAHYSDSSLDKPGRVSIEKLILGLGNRLANYNFEAVPNPFGGFDKPHRIDQGKSTCNENPTQTQGASDTRT